MGVFWLVTVLAVAARAREVPQDARSTSRTVWDGVFTEEQAARGSKLYIQWCSGCHAEDLRGDGTAPSLIEESFAFLFEDITLGELLGKVRTMPPGRNNLPEQTYVDIVAYVLQSNELPAGSSELDSSSAATDAIRITKARPGGKFH